MKRWIFFHGSKKNCSDEVRKGTQRHSLGLHPLQEALLHICCRAKWINNKEKTLRFSISFWVISHPPKGLVRQVGWWDLPIWQIGRLIPGRWTWMATHHTSSHACTLSLGQGPLSFSKSNCKCLQKGRKKTGLCESHCPRTGASQLLRPGAAPPSRPPHPYHHVS